MGLCEWCGKPALEERDYCSDNCKKELNAEFEAYLNKYNDYMAGYDVTFEKMKKKPKRKEDQ